jgi:hypothetical protein
MVEIGVRTEDDASMMDVNVIAGKVEGFEDKSI